MFLEEVYVSAPYSLLRAHTIRAMLPHTARRSIYTLVAEALWDCEPEGRLLALRAIEPCDLTSRRRRREIQGDPFEDPEVRGEAWSARPSNGG